MLSYHLMHPNSNDLMLTINGPKSIVIPNDWCEKENNVAICICQHQNDVQIIDIGQVTNEDMQNGTHTGSEDSLANVVDWWIEGVVLLIICGVGIIGALGS